MDLFQLQVEEFEHQFPHLKTSKENFPFFASDAREDVVITSTKSHTQYHEL